VLAHDTVAPRALALRSLTLPALGRFAAHSPRVTSDPGLVQLPPREPLPRELDNGEVAALMLNTSDDVRLLAVALLTGLSPAEIVALSWDQIDFDSATIAVGGDARRTLALEEPFATLLERRRQAAADSAATVLHDERGGPLTTEELSRLILCGAYDAGLDSPQQVTPVALRHTYLACLLRRGIRAVDISRIAGHIPHEDLVTYMQLTASRSRLPLEQIDKVHPGLRGLTGRASL
jgi:integrase